jgi:polysaccharide export outer membrane protein
MGTILRFTGKLVAATAILIAVAACSSAQDTAPAIPASAPAAVSAQGIPGALTGPLCPGDLIEFSVYGVPEMTQRVRLNSEGVVYLPLLNDVKLSGLNPEEAQKKLEGLLVDGGFLRAPHVTVTVVEYANGISVLGEVMRPGVYPAGGARHLYDVIAAAGGLTQNAGTLVTISHTQHPDKPEAVTISRDPSKAPDANVLISPGDTVVVGKAGIIYVVGEVVQPSGLIMDGEGQFTVLKAIAMARGVTRTAKLNNTKVLRKNDKGFTEIPVPLAKIMSAKANDVPLQPDDIVFVPTNVAKNAATRTLQTALSMVASVVVVRTSQP